MIRLQIEKIEVLSAGKILGAIQTVAGFVIGFFMTLLSLFGQASAVADDSISFGVWSVVAFPVLNGIIGFLSGIVFAFIYNLLTRYTGGVVFQCAEE